MYRFTAAWWYHFFFCIFAALFAVLRSGEIQCFAQQRQLDYVVSLKNGDVLTGKLLQDKNPVDEKHTASLAIQTRVGVVTIATTDILSLIPQFFFYRQSHHTCLLPTAFPISDNHYLGSYELVGMETGVGIGNIVSINGSGVLLPSVASVPLHLHIKATLFAAVDEGGTGVGAAIGGNFLRLTPEHSMLHLYSVATYTEPAFSINGIIMVHCNQQSRYNLTFGRLYHAEFEYQTGAVGIGFSADVALSDHKDIRLIGEFWTPRLQRFFDPTLVALGAVRFCNRTFSADFGMFFQPWFLNIPQQLAIPFVRCSWTPFL